jgi:hypothetical protein
MSRLSYLKDTSTSTVQKNIIILSLKLNAQITCIVFLSHRSIHYLPTAGLDGRAPRVIVV